jgi:hypothetical protein
VKAPPQATASRRRKSAVVRIDLRDSATGPDAGHAGTLDADAMANILRCSPPGQGKWLLDVGRVLVVDTAAAFARHAAAYRQILDAPTTWRLLCLIVGPPPVPGGLELPQPVTARNVTILWVGDPRGVGWRLGLSTTTCLAVDTADPEGNATLDELIGALSRHEVFDKVTETIGKLSERAAAPAVLPAARWPGPELLALLDAQEAEEHGADSWADPPPASVGGAELLRSPDIRAILLVLGSYGPAIAQCERLLAAAEAAADHLPRIPGTGGRRAWHAVIAASKACAQLAQCLPAVPAGPDVSAIPVAPGSGAAEGTGPGAAPAVGFLADVAARLRQPAAASMGASAAILLPLLACGCALTTLIRPWAWGVAAGTWIAVLGGATLLRAGLPGSAQRRRPSWRAAVLFAAAAAAGAAAGAVLAGLADPIGHLGLGRPVAESASAGLGVLMLIIVMFTWWRRAAHRWLHSLRLAEARQVLERLPHEIAAGAADQLQHMAESWQRDEQQRWARWWSATRNGLREKLTRQLTDGLCAEVTATALATVRSYLRQEGLASADDSDSRSGPPSATGQGAPGSGWTAQDVRAAIGNAASVLSAAADDERFLQLTGAEQLPILDAAPQSAKLVKFAPVAARDVLGKDGSTADVTWTDSGDRVGIMRFVPLRAGVLRGCRSADDPTARIRLTIDVADGSDEHGLAALATWLLSDDDLRGMMARITSESEAMPGLSAQLPDTATVRTLVYGIAYWLCRQDDIAAAIRLTRPDGITTTLTAADVAAAADAELDAIVDRTVGVFT